MSYIAGYPLFIISGKIGRGGQKVVEISKDGVNGQAYTLKGVKARPSEIVTFRDFDTAALANAQILLYEALRGAFVTVIDEDLITYNNVMVLHCDPVATNTTGAAVGGFGVAPTGRTTVTMAWVLQLN